MRMEKKRILKEDGRYLTYYHFPDSATAEQNAAFAAVVPIDAQSKSNTPPVATQTPHTQSEEKSHV